MPQLDKYIFLNQILTLFVFFFLIYFYVRGTIIPNINSMLKYRSKKRELLIFHDKEHWRLIKDANLKFGKFGLRFLGLINNHSFLTSILEEYRLKFEKESHLINSFYTRWLLKKKFFNHLKKLNVENVRFLLKIS